MSERTSKECLLSEVETFKLPVMLVIRSDFSLNENLILYNGKKIALLQRELVKLLFGTDWYGKEFRLNTYDQINILVNVVDVVYPETLEEVKSLVPKNTYILSKSQYDYNIVTSSSCAELKFSNDETFNDINKITLTTIDDKKIFVSLDSLLNKEYFVFVVSKEKISLQMLLVKNVFPQTVRFLNSSNFQLPDGIAILQNVHVYDTVVTVTENQPCDGNLTYEIFQLNSKIRVSVLKKERPKYLISFGDYHTKSYRNKIGELKNKMKFNIYSAQFYGVFIEEKPTKMPDLISRVSTPKLAFLKKGKLNQSFISEDDETLLESSLTKSSENLSAERDSLSTENGHLSSKGSIGKRRMAIKKKLSAQTNSFHIEDDAFNDELPMFPLRKDKTQRLSQSENNLITAFTKTLNKSLDENTLLSIMTKRNSKSRQSFNIYTLQEEKNGQHIQLLKTRSLDSDKSKLLNSKTKLEYEAEETSSNQDKNNVYLTSSENKAYKRAKCKSESFLNRSVESLNTYYTSLIYSDVPKARVFTNDLQMREVYSIEEIKSFTIEEVGNVLKKLNLSKYKNMFKKQLINGRLLINLSEEALREMKLTHFEARKLYKYVHGWRAKEKNSKLNSTIDRWSVNDVVSAMDKINLKKLSMFISDNQVDGALLKDIIDNGIIKTLEKEYGIHLIRVEQERLLTYIQNSLMYEEKSPERICNR